MFRVAMLPQHLASSFEFCIIYSLHLYLSLIDRVFIFPANFFECLVLFVTINISRFRFVFLAFYSLKSYFDH